MLDFCDPWGEGVWQILTCSSTYVLYLSDGRWKHQSPSRLTPTQGRQYSNVKCSCEPSILFSAGNFFLNLANLFESCSWSINVLHWQAVANRSFHFVAGNTDPGRRACCKCSLLHEQQERRRFISTSSSETQTTFIKKLFLDHGFHFQLDRNRKLHDG